MHTEVLPVDSSCNRQIVEQIHEMFVHVLVVLLKNLLAEIVILRALAGLVITAQHYDILRISILHGAEKNDDFRAIHSTVNIVAQKEQLLYLPLIAVDLLQHVKHIIELAVNIANDSNVSIDTQNIWLSLKLLLGPEDH